MFTLRDILVPTDFSEYSLHALDEATRLAAPFGANIHLLHVVEEEEATFKDHPFGDQTVREHVTDQACRKLADLQTRYSNFCMFPHVRYGRAAFEIVECANALDANMIALATHGRSGLARLVLGSIAEQVVRMAKCPVLTVREPTRTAPLSASV